MLDTRVCALLHHQHFFPEEPTFFERSWFGTERFSFEVADIRGIGVGVLLCTELMFPEWARHYGRRGSLPHCGASRVAGHIMSISENGQQ